MNSSAMWRASWTLYRTNFLALFLVFLPLAVAFLVVLAPLLALPDQQIPAGGGTPDAVLLAFAFALVVIPMVVGGVAVSASALLLTDRIVGQAARPLQAYRRIPNVGPVIAAALASTLLSLMLRQLLAPLEFFLRPLLYGPAIVVQVIVLETFDLRAALTRAGQLLRKETLRIFMYLFAVSLGVSLLALLLPGFATLGVSDINSTTYFVFASALQILIWILILPFVAAAELVAYFDLRARKENLNLEALAAEQGGVL